MRARGCRVGDRPDGGGASNFASTAPMRASTSASFLIAAVALAACGAACAEPGGVSGVSGASVTAGRTSVEARTAAFAGDEMDGDWVHRLQANHGFTDWWRLGAIVRASQPEDGDFEATAFGVESLFDIVQTRDWPVHLGAQFEYRFGMNGRDDETHLKLIAESQSGPVNLRLNMILVRDNNDGEDREPAFSVRATWGASDDLGLALEAFAEPDDNKAYVGPRVTWRFGEATLALGYLAGLEDAAADHQFRLGLEIAR